MLQRRRPEEDGVLRPRLDSSDSDPRPRRSQRGRASAALTPRRCRSTAEGGPVEGYRDLLLPDMPGNCAIYLAVIMRWSES